MTSPIRVIIYGVGQVNQLATRLMREKGIDVVGAINRAGPKVGQELGLLAGLEAPIGVTVSDEVDSVLQTPADLVLVAVYDDLERMMPIFRQCIERKLNVISVGAHHSYPWRMTPALAVELDELTKQHGVTITGTGNQDFFIVNLGTMMSGVCHSIERLIHRSLTDVNGFGPEVAEVTFVGQSVAEFEAGSGNLPPSIYTTFWDNVASDLALDVIDIAQRLEPVVADTPRYCRPFDRTIEPGELLGIRQHLDVTTVQGIAMHGENEIRVGAPGEEDFKEWEIIGEPSYTIRASKLDNALTTTTQCVNRIPHVIAAPPGYVTLEKLPKLTFRSQLTRLS